MKKNGLFFALLFVLFSANNCMAKEIRQALVCDYDSVTGAMRFVSIEEKIDELTRTLQAQGVNVDELLHNFHINGHDVIEIREARNDEISVLSNQQQMVHHSLQMLYHGLYFGKATIFFIVNDVVVPYAPRVGTSMKQVCIDIKKMVLKRFTTDCNFQTA